MLLENILQILSWVSVSTITIILLSLWALWILYVAMMNVQRVSLKEELPWQAKLLVVPTKFVFDIVEFFCNVVVCTVLFLDLPREVTVSDRLRRYYKDSNSNRWKKLILNFFKPMIDPFDPDGTHIQ